jgi:hypothetical protein
MCNLLLFFSQTVKLRPIRSHWKCAAWAVSSSHVFSDVLIGFLSSRAASLLGQFVIGPLHYWTNCLLGQIVIGPLHYWASWLLGQIVIGPFHYWAN